MVTETKQVLKALPSRTCIISKYKHIRWWDFLNQESATFICKWWSTEHFQLCRMYSHHWDYLTLPLYLESCHRQYIKEWTYMCPAAAKSLQSCPTLCDPIDGSPPGSPIPGILQAKTLEWVAISFSNAWKWKVKVKSLSCVQLSETPWTVGYKAPPSMGFSRQEHWSRLPFPSPLW